MKNQFTIQFSPTRLKQMKKIALSGSRAKLKMLNGKFTEGFHLLKNTAKKFKSFATDLADKIPQALAARISLDLFAHFESKSSKRLGIPKGIVLGGVLALMASLPAAGQVANTTAELVTAITNANGTAGNEVIFLGQGTTYTLTGALPTIVDQATGGTLQIICTGTTNAIIDGAGSFRPLRMAAGSDLTITKITVQNGSSTKGGGIFNNNGDLTISNSLITNNKTTGVNGKGAGVYSKGNGVGASILIQNSTISFNSSSKYGGGIYNAFNSPLTITSSSISGNTSNSNGGGIYNFDNSPLTISSSSISGNTSNSNGGGIWNQFNSPLTISSSSISGNLGIGISNTSSNLTIQGSSISGNLGGGINNSDSNLTIQGSSISGNLGSGIRNTTNSNLTIQGSSISGNLGSGIRNTSSNLTIQGSSISGNTHANRGAGIALYETSTGGHNILLKNTTISGNTSGGEGGGIHSRSTVLGNTLTLQHVTLSDNTGGGAAGTGDGFDDGVTSLFDLTIQNSIIANSTGTGGSDFALGGGSIIVTASIIESSTSPITSATVIDPMLNALAGGVHTLQAGSPAIGAASTADATTNDQLGVARTAPHTIGAVQYIIPPCIFDVTTNADTGAGSLRQAITDANANIDDCIIYVDGGETYTIASNLPAIDDKATGGTLQIISTGTLNAVISGDNSFRPITMDSNSDLKLSNITITSGSALKGGGIYNNQGDLTISSCLITNNEATGIFINGKGGGIYSKGDNVNPASASVLIQNSMISHNSASQQGGGIHNSRQSLLTISNSSISGSTSVLFGGGIYNNSSPNLTISSSNISGNTSPSSGGGIFNKNSDNLSITSSTISGNTGSFGGGIINLSSDNLSISSSSISGNTSTNQGGGIYNYNSSMTIQASSITLNSATTSKGGGIYINSKGTDVVSIINTTISSNEASAVAGGGIYAKSTGASNTLSLKHVTISDNSGVGTGGFANDATSTMNITIQNSIIANSTGFDFDVGGAGIIVTASIIESSVTPITSATVLDPLLGALTLNSGFLVHPLQVSSVAIGAGANIGIGTDQVGNARVPANPAIGAVEVTTADLVCMVVTAPAGVTNTWIGCTNSDWNTATNWSSGAVPTASDVVYVPIVAANQLVIDEVATCAKMVVQIGAKCLVNYNAGGKLLIKF